MLNKESISVVIPLYNAEKYIGEALESVLQQTIKPAEIIVVDDGSTDGGANVVKNIGADITLIRQENMGISRARNTGIRKATGSIIAFLDSDDLWPENHLDILLSALKKDENLAIVCGHVKQFMSEDTDVNSNRIPEGAEIMPGYVVGASLIRREVFDEVGLFNEDLTLADTVDFFARAKDAGQSFKLIDDIVLKRRIHSSNIGIRHREKRHDYTKVLMASIKRKRENEKNN